MQLVCCMSKKVFQNSAYSRTSKSIFVRQLLHTGCIDFRDGSKLVYTCTCFADGRQIFRIGLHRSFMQNSDEVMNNKQAKFSILFVLTFLKILMIISP